MIADGGDIYGEGVNIAARPEGLAAPGSVCVSGTVRDHIGDRLPYAFILIPTNDSLVMRRAIRGKISAVRSLVASTFRLLVAILMPTLA